MLNWLLGLDFEYIFKKLGRIAQMVIGEKWEKEKSIFQEFSLNFKPLHESQLMWTPLHFIVVLILPYEFEKSVQVFDSETSTYWEQEFNQ